VRVVVDECTGPSVARWLRKLGHDVVSIYDDFRGLSDEKILDLAVQNGRLLITNDKGFGTAIYRDGRQHAGLLLIRMNRPGFSAARAAVAHGIAAFESLTEQHVVIVATEEGARIGR
jgi:predicted nuclease of predicted toxin-antitoxin system